MLGNFAFFLSSAEFLNVNFFTKSLSQKTIRVSNSLGPDQAEDLSGQIRVQTVLQRLSADDTGMHRAKLFWSIIGSIV